MQNYYVYFWIWYTTAEKIEYYNKRLFDGTRTIEERVYASRRLRKLTTTLNKGTPEEIKSKKIPTKRNLVTPVWVENYVLSKGGNKGSHAALPIEQVDGNYSVVGITSQEKTDNKRNYLLATLRMDKKILVL